MDAVFAVLQFWSWPVLAMAVSVTYYLVSRSGSVSRVRRVLVSAHGASIAALHLGAMAVWMTGASSPRFGRPFGFALLVPLGLIAYSLFAFRGNRSIHWLQLLNLVALFFAAFIGGMAITGEWL